MADAGRARHPNKEIEAALQFAEAHGRTYLASNEHPWGIYR